MAKHVYGKNRVWQVASVWIKRRDGPERILNAYRLLLDLPPQRAIDRLVLVPRQEWKAAGGAECTAIPGGASPSDPQE
jgi:hypothetical protein